MNFTFFVTSELTAGARSFLLIQNPGIPWRFVFCVFCLLFVALHAFQETQAAN
jgi:hypothetical protein